MRCNNRYRLPPVQFSLKISSKSFALVASRARVNRFLILKDLQMRITGQTLLQNNQTMENDQTKMKHMVMDQPFKVFTLQQKRIKNDSR